jgi:hypothetical protein
VYGGGSGLYSVVPTAFESVGAGGELGIMGRPRRGLLPAPVSKESSAVSGRFMCDTLCLVDVMAATIPKTAMYYKSMTNCSPTYILSIAGVAYSGARSWSQG